MGTLTQGLFKAQSANDWFSALTQEKRDLLCEKHNFPKTETNKLLNNMVTEMHEKENADAVAVKYNSKDLVIEFHDNPKTGACSITEWASKTWKKGIGIPEIDNIPFHLVNDAEKDCFKIINKPTGDVVFYVEGQKALLLSILAETLITILGIEITR